MSTSPCRDCGTTDGLISRDSVTPKRTRGLCHKCYQRHRSNGTDKEFDKTGQATPVQDHIVSLAASRTGLDLSKPCVTDWPYSRTATGRPDAYWNGRMHRAARAILLACGIDMGGKDASHECHNGECIEPDHIVPMDSSEHLSRDKGGENCHSSKLTEDDVVDVFRLRSEGWTQKKIADHYEINQSNVSQILLRKTWAGVEIPRALSIGPEIDNGYTP